MTVGRAAALQVPVTVIPAVSPLPPAQCCISQNHTRDKQAAAAVVQLHKSLLYLFLLTLIERMYML
jgi:hypothetical protein